MDMNPGLIVSVEKINILYSMFIIVVVAIFPARQSKTVNMSWIPVYVWWQISYAVLRAKGVFFTMTYIFQLGTNESTGCTW